MVALHTVDNAPQHSDAIDVDGFLTDIDEQAISVVPKVTFKDCSHDVDHFFSPQY
jgi:hypothetical protein